MCIRDSPNGSVTMAVTGCDRDWIGPVLGPRSPYLWFYAVTEASRNAAEAFCPRLSDVAVATYTKCGTTLMQQLVEMLRSGGQLTFEEITQVQPWIDFCHDIKVDPDAEQLHWPRVYKSHQPLASLPRTGRVVSVVRDPAAVLKSYYSFYTAKNHPLVQGKTLAEWGAEWIATGTWEGHIIWDYYLQLWKCWAAVRDGIREASNEHGSKAALQVAASAGLLLVEFNALAKGLDTHVPRVAGWLNGAEGGNVDTSAENLQQAVDLTSRETMAAHDSQFDDHWLHACLLYTSPSPRDRTRSRMPSSA
eukprot:TRINITY_DN21434_c0_g1_i3.p1 TRINITY_DN21434_c0_g1~~TRINITY_DN21434_c0_g1_i3.p1  ORF type:complete len:305 (+),score=62.20 TRINITY_DN21434_c0_g1_i3:103-1017(+)